jgi:O-antigen/teichoic acid export membrane protein
MRKIVRGDFVRHGLIVFGSSMLVNAFSYVFHLSMSRKLGVTDYGTLYSLFATLTLLGVPTSVLTMIVVRYAAEFRAVGDLGKLAALSRWIVVRTAAIAVAVTAGGWFAAPGLARYLNVAQVDAVGWTSVVVALGIILPGIRGVLQGVEDFGRLAISSVLEGLLKAALGIGFVYAGLGVVGAIAGYALATAIGVLYTGVAVRAHTSAAPEPLRLDVRRLVLTSSGVAFATLGLSVFGSADLLLVKHFFPPREAGLYSVVSLVGKVLLFVIGFIPTLVLPKATARATAGRSPLTVLAQAGVAIAGICGCGLAVLWFAPELVVRVMAGAAFAAAAPLVFEYGVAMTILGATTAVVVYRVGIHRFEFVPFLLSIAVAEIAAINFYHPSLLAVVRVLIAAHAAALVSSLVGLRRTAKVSTLNPARVVSVGGGEVA